MCGNTDATELILNTEEVDVDHYYPAGYAPIALVVINRQPDIYKLIKVRGGNLNLEKCLTFDQTIFTVRHQAQTFLEFILSHGVAVDRD